MRFLYFGSTEHKAERWGKERSAATGCFAGLLLSALFQECRTFLGWRCSPEASQRAQPEKRAASCLSGTLPAVFCRDLEEESKQEDFQMVFVRLPLCFLLEGEAATALNLGLEEPGAGSWRGGRLM